MRVSVILPFRGSRGDLPYLNQAIDSLAAQTLQPDEVLLIDDHSDPAAIEELKARETPIAVTVIPNAGDGSAAARNTGLHAATGEWLLMHDADDVSLPTRLERLMVFVQTDPAEAIGSLCAYIGRASQPVSTQWTREYSAVTDWATKPHEIAALMPHRCCIIPPSMLLRREPVEEIGGWNESLRFASYDLLLRLLPSVRFAKIPERVYAYRLHPNSETQREPALFMKDLALAREFHARE